MGIFDQEEFDVRFEWGPDGLHTLAPLADTVVIVDVLSFTTCASIAVERGATVFPYTFADDSALSFAQSMDAHLAVRRRETSPTSAYSLSPQSMLTATAGTRIVLPSPNGSALAFAARDATTSVFAGCLRNAKAIAQASRDGSVAVIAAGERWRHMDTLRPAAEDLLGAGAIIRELAGTRSPEAAAAVAVFDSVKDEIREFLMQTVSGKELRSSGYDEDVALASEYNVTSTVPVMTERAFVRAN